MALNWQQTAADAPAVITRDLTRRFGRFVALDKVNLEVPSGALLGLLGPNGSGKTTLLSILAGFIASTSGGLRLLGETDHRRALARTGSLISKPLFWPHLTCRENLRCMQGIFAGASNLDSVELLLTQVGLEGDAADRKFGHCSTGMKQHLGIAAALMGNPHLVFLDEPTTGLDPEGMVEIRELVRSLGKQEDRTIIMSSHLLNEVEQTCDSYAIIFRGNLVDQGTLVGPSGTFVALQLETTDNELAAQVLESVGWNISRVPPRNGRPTCLEVETAKGEEWKVVRDLAERGIYPSAMQKEKAQDGPGSLEQQYLKAVGRATPSSGQEPHV